MESKDNKAAKAKKVLLLGSTGSIGQSTLKVAADHPDRLDIIGLAGGQNVEKLIEQATQTGAQLLYLYDEAGLPQLREALPQATIYSGEDGLIELVQAAAAQGAETLLVAIVGTAGLKPTLTAIDCGMDIAIASKEILVMAGQQVMSAAKEKGVQVLPVDSEHNAIFQCLEGCSKGNKNKQLSKLILTASGGPFRNTPAEELSSVTPAQALAHPTWEMGQKISIDSATLFNKGLEMIEARWLFDCPMSQIEVVIHPQSIVHSLVEFIDGSQLAQLSHSDMCFPIQYALFYPERLSGSLPPLKLHEIGNLEFAEPRYQDFPALRLARYAGEQGGGYPTVLNAANEVAVATFLNGGYSFPEIWQHVEDCLDDFAKQNTPKNPTLEELLEIESWAGEFTKNKTLT